MSESLRMNALSSLSELINLKLNLDEEEVNLHKSIDLLIDNIIEAFDFCNEDLLRSLIDDISLITDPYR